MKGKRIALFLLPLLTNGGGAEKYFINLARNFREKGIETDVITMDEAFFAKFAKLLYLFTYRRWFRHIDISGRESEEAVRQQLGQARWVKVKFKNLGRTLREYDVIYSKNELVDLFLLKIIGYRNLPSVIVGVHTPLYFPQTRAFITKLHNLLYLGFFYRWLLRGVKCLHVSNKATKEIAEKHFKLKSQLVYYPFSADEIISASQNIDSGLAFEKEKFNIAFAGRLSEQKGVGALASIISKLSESDHITPKVSINIFGSGDEKHENIVNNLAKNFSFVKCFGHIENKFMPNILSRHDLLISTSQWETLPYNILEVQAMGLPVIAFDIPGPSDIIIDGSTGFLVKGEKEFAEKIISVIEKKTIFDRKEIIRNIKNKFDPDKIHLQLLDMFKENI